MATNYSQVSYGSKGSDVKTLQEMLNSNGYSLDVDGVFGSKTQAAVKDYQKKNSLSADGIVGKNTWGTLSSASSGGSTSNAGAATAGTTAKASTSAADMSFSYDDYQKSDAVMQAEALLQQQLANKPGEYTSAWSDQISALIDQITNREKFSYDLNADALYQQYADQYATQGKLAMMDTMGQAAAMTGGYGNSYAQTVGQQTYQGYLQQLNEVVPELYQMALNQYNQEGEDMYNQYGLLTSQDEQDYGRYRDQMSDYYTELERLTEDARYLSEDEYNKYLNDLNFKYGVFSDEKSYAYQSERDAVSDDQWQKSYEYQQSRDAIADAQWQKEYDESVRQYNEEMALTKSQISSSGGSGGSGSGTGESGYSLNHVSSMSSNELVSALKNYQADEDDTGLAAFLDDLVATGRISDKEADRYYETYKTKKTNNVTDTTVNSSAKKTSGGGGGSKFMYTALLD